VKQWLLLTAIALMCISGGVARTEAASTLVFEAVAVDASQGGPAGRIYAGSQSMMTVGGHGAQSINDALEIARRLNGLAEAGLRGNEIKIFKVKRDRVLVARGQKIVTVDKTTARFHSADRAKLAQTWLSKLSKQFSQPYLAAQPLVVPLGESRAVAVKGNIGGKVRVRVESPVVSASYEWKSKAVRVVGQAVGQTELVIFDDYSTLLVPVRAAKYAGRLTTPIAAGVTGNPASGEVVYRAAQAAVAAQLALEPGAWASITPVLTETAPLRQGASRAVPVKFTAAGDDYLPYRAQPAVMVRNESVALGPVDVLMVSNSPERLLSHGLWFEGSLQEYQSARLLYHHVNSTGVHSDLVVELWNLGDRTGRVHVIAGKGGPSNDEAWAGHKAAVQFLADRANGIGWVVPVPPRTAVPIMFQEMSPGSTASGLLEMRSLGGGNLRVRCYLSPSRSSWLPYPIRTYDPSPVLGKWLYPQPRQEITAKYVVGREWAFVTIGDPAIPGLNDGDRLAGNYGVIYDITMELVNPNAEPAPVEIVVEPGGGAARAVLLVNGKQVEVALLKRDAEVRIARYVLTPGEVRSVRIQTTPQSGSNYPVRLVARTI
jgi:hypothetical protein